MRSWVSVYSSISVLVKNVGMLCWDHCQRSGPCDLCGEIGMCCRKGTPVRGCDGKSGGEGLHYDSFECVHPPGNSKDTGKTK